MTKKTYKIFRDGKPFLGFWGMQYGFAEGAFAMIQTQYNIPYKYELICEKTDEVVDTWGPNKVHINSASKTPN